MLEMGKKKESKITFFFFQFSVFFSTFSIFFLSKKKKKIRNDANYMEQRSFFSNF